MNDFTEILIKTVLLVAVQLLLFVWPFQLCWNEFLVPAIAGVHEIGLLQAMGLICMCQILNGTVGLKWNDKK